jgi:integration host factor subunit alpha
MANERLGRESGKTVTRADLSEIVYQRVGLSRTESAELVQSVLDEICDAAARGETVKLSGFGSFVVRSKGERVGRNPKTGVEVPILPRRVMVFKPRSTDATWRTKKTKKSRALVPREPLAGIGDSDPARLAASGVSSQIGR